MPRLLCAALLLSAVPAAAGPIELSAQLQLWNVYSMGAEDPAGDPLEDRWDLYLRRGRLRLRGQARAGFDYQLVFAYDAVGKNAQTTATGRPQPADNGEFYLWDAIVTWHLRAPWLHLTMGYFRPQVGRESITSAFSVNSFTKALTNGFPRLHLVGTGPGRETGLNLGGLHHHGAWGLHYNVGVFDVDREAAGSPAGGRRWSPLVCARLAWTLGDPEMDDYGLAYRINAFGTRNGVTLAAHVAHQGATDLFERNGLHGVDLLASRGRLTLDAELDWLRRTVEATGSRAAASSADRVYHARVGYTVPLAAGRMLEPVYMVSGFEGDPHSPIAPDALQRLHEIGLNLYLDANRYRLGLHYGRYDGDDERSFVGASVQCTVP